MALYSAGMKNILLVALLLSVPASAIEWKIIGPTVYSGTFSADLKKPVGAATVELLEEKKIPFVGNESGINSIMGTPTGDDAIEIISAESMKVYGWCYEVDGVQPDVMPDEYFFPKQASKLTWFYSYSLYEKGEWKSYCTPAFGV